MGALVCGYGRDEGIGRTVELVKETSRSWLEVDDGG
jgi:hypothetical protein